MAYSQDIHGFDHISIDFCCFCSLGISGSVFLTSGLLDLLW